MIDSDPFNYGTWLLLAVIIAPLAYTAAAELVVLITGNKDNSNDEG